jgi:hypothetical protein
MVRVSKRSNRASGGLPVEAGVALRRPRLLPLSDEQKAEAVALFSELLLAAARPRAGGRNVPSDGAEGSWRRGFGASELNRKGLAA